MDTPIALQRLNPPNSFASGSPLDVGEVSHQGQTPPGANRKAPISREALPQWH